MLRRHICLKLSERVYLSGEIAPKVCEPTDLGIAQVLCEQINISTKGAKLYIRYRTLGAL